MNHNKKKTVRQGNANGFAFVAMLTFSFLIFCSSSNIFAANHYIRDGGSGDGSDWTNAWDDLPTNLVRGDTYYIADGEYGAHAFDDALDGTKYTYIIKAVEDDHGTETGWASSYGDGEAVFSAKSSEAYVFSFDTGYYDIDGQTGGGPNSWDSGFGIRVQGTLASQKVIQMLGFSLTGAAPTHINLRHLDIPHRGIGYITNDDCIYCGDNLDDSSVTNILIEYCALRDTSRLQINTFNDKFWTLQYSYIARNSTVDPLHSEAWQTVGGEDMIVRWNKFEDITGTSVIAFKRQPVPVGRPGNLPGARWSIYGNIFWMTDSAKIPGETDGPGQGIISMAENVVTPAPQDDTLFYNNTIVNFTFRGRTGVEMIKGTNTIVKNNIWYQHSRPEEPSGTRASVFFGNATPEEGDAVVNTDYNIFIDAELIASASQVKGGNDIEDATGDPFIDWVNQDFRLTSPTVAGTTLPPPYDTDMFGNTRGIGGNWSRGALQYTGPVAVAKITAPADPNNINDDDDNNIEQVTLSASDSYDTYPVGGNLSYTWNDDQGDNIPNEENPTADLSVGTHTVTLTVTDSNSLTDTVTITIIINGDGRKTLQILESNNGATTPLDGDSYQYDTGSEPNIVATPDNGYVLNNWTGTTVSENKITQDPNNPNKITVLMDGNYTLTANFIVAGGGGLSAAGAGDPAPILAPIGNKTVNEEESLSFMATATDGFLKTFSATGTAIAAGASITAGGAFSWTPTEAQGPGTYTATIRVTYDGTPGLFDEETITITVNEINTAPEITPAIGNKSTSVGLELKFNVQVNDSDVPANTLTYSLEGTPPAGAAIDSTGEFTWTPGANADAGSPYSITVRVTDVGGLFAEDTFIVTVTADITPPTVTLFSPVELDTNTLLDENVPIDSLVALSIVDPGEGVNLSTVKIRIDGNLIHDGNAETDEKYDTTATLETWQVKGICERTGNSLAYNFYFQADADFDLEQTISVTVDASDLAANAMTQYTFNFVTADNPDPTFSANTKVNSTSDKAASNVDTVTFPGDGAILAVWQQNNDIYYGELVSGEDSFDSNLESNLTDEAVYEQVNPIIDTDGTDIFILWQEGEPSDLNNIVVFTSANSWADPIAITDPGNSTNQTNPAMAIDSTGKIYVTWLDDDADIKVSTSADSGATWAAAVDVATGLSSAQTQPAIAIDENDVAYIVWANDNGDIIAADSATGPWTNVSIDETGDMANPVIAAESTGSVLHILWNSVGEDEEDVYHCYTANGLSDPCTINITNTTGAQINPTIAVDGTKVYAAWKNVRSEEQGDKDIFYAVKTGTSFGTLTQVNDDSEEKTHCEQPVINLDVNGKPYIAWSDKRGDPKYSIYFSTTASPLATKLVDSEDTDPNYVEIDDTTEGVIDSIDDAVIVIPAGAMPADLTIMISQNSKLPVPTIPAGFPDNAAVVGAHYEFGPSGLTFPEDKPVTITIPHDPADENSIFNTWTILWYNPKTEAWQLHNEIGDVEHLEISDTLHTVKFTTTHFTSFVVIGSKETVPGGGGGGGGGCSVSPYGGGSVLEFLLPYAVIGLVLAGLKLKNKRKKSA